MEQRQLEEFFNMSDDGTEYRFVVGFVAGAMWLEYEQTGFTMRQGDQRVAECEGLRRIAESDPLAIENSADYRFIAGFVEGAKWWEFYETRSALSPENLAAAKAEAARRVG
jgi:hypothetical protein